MHRWRVWLNSPAQVFYSGWGYAAYKVPAEPEASPCGS
jgi:hypothetical protein